MNYLLKIRKYLYFLSYNFLFIKHIKWKADHTTFQLPEREALFSNQRVSSTCYIYEDSLRMISTPQE
jgi:hypothetical protein